MTSVHWYKATSETFNTAASLLDEAPIRKEMINLAEIVRVSNRWASGGLSLMQAQQTSAMHEAFFDPV